MFWWIIAAVCAFFIKGLCGFANTLVFTSLLSFGNNNILISPVELILGYPTNIILAWKERRFIQWKVCLPLAGLTLLGSICGVLFLKNADASVIKLLFGIVVMLIGVEMLFRETYRRQLPQSKPLLIIAGILSGLLCGLYGVGALLGVYIGRIAENSRSFKANICIVFIIENTFRVIAYLIEHILAAESALRALVLSPFMVLGLFAGMFCGRFFNENGIKKIVIILLIISGIVLAVHSALRIF